MAWPLTASHYAELLNPLWGTHALRARVEAVWDETSDTRTLTLRPSRGFRAHRAGQFVPVRLVVDGVERTRHYSISSAPERGDGCFTITVKAQGAVSRQLVRHARQGDIVGVGQPAGEFALPEARPVRPLFVTGGSGITPVMSMLRSLAAQGRLRDVVHVHYAPAARDVIFARELLELRARHPGYGLELVATRRPGAARFSSVELARLCPDFDGRDVYACGPAGLLAAVEGTFEDLGLAARVNVERFSARLAAPAEGAVAGRVRFSRSRAEADSDGRTSLLQLAERAGLAPRHGCRMGICHECTTTLVCGAVRDLRTNALIHEPGAPVQPCVCAAAGDAEIDV